MEFHHQEQEDEDMPLPISSTYGHNHIVPLSLHHHHQKPPHTDVSNTTVPPPPLPSIEDLSKKMMVVVRYKECLKNHAASMGGKATDGCGEFLPSGEEGTLKSHTEMMKTFKIWKYREQEIPLAHIGPMKIMVSVAQGLFASQGNTKLFKNVIRVLCNANTSEGFVPNRDVSMIEINAPYNGIPIVSGGQSPYNRSILAFFAGGNHGYGGRSDICGMCSGYNQEQLCFTNSDVLDWSQFSVQVSVDKIPDLKRILEDIPFLKYLEMQKRVMEVQRHFMVNYPAKQFDVFHMILHSVWLRRLNI
nr:exostosin-like protein [Tanacetum cinerariifolium]